VARIAQLEGAKTRLQRLDCKDVLYILEVIIRVLAAAVTQRDSFGERSIPRSKIVYLTGAVINAYYIEPRQFLEDAGVVLERVRNVTERHNGVKVQCVQR